LSDVDFIIAAAAHLAAETAKAATRKPKPTEYTQFHGKETHDYQGRSWIEPPSDLKPRGLESFAPKKQIHQWAGHAKGVQAIRFFPTYGHLLLSGGLDGKVVIWDVMGRMGKRRTYMGHVRGVRDIAFSNDGRRFLSASFDKYIKEWDTETGQCLGVFSNKAIPFCVRYYPNDNSSFLAGCNDKKIIQVC